jgi:integrase
MADQDKPISQPAVPSSVLRLTAGKLPAEALALLSGPVGQAVAQAAGYAGRALSDNTRRVYASDWKAFTAWCRDGDVSSLPAEPVVIAGHLASLATSLGRSGLKRRLAAIAHMHRQGGHPWEPGHPAIRATLRGILASHAKPVRPAAALTSTEVKQLLNACGTDLAGLRDRAIFLVGFAGALRRSELVAIDREHLRFTTDGMTVHIPRSKRDQEGEGADLGIPRGLNPLTCPVRAVEQWLQRTRIAILHRAVRQVAQSDAFRAKMEPLGFAPVSDESPAAFGEYLKSQETVWKDLVEVSGATLD